MWNRTGIGWKLDWHKIIKVLNFRMRSGVWYLFNTEFCLRTCYLLLKHVYDILKGGWTCLVLYREVKFNDIIFNVLHREVTFVALRKMMWSRGRMKGKKRLLRTEPFR